MIKLTNKLRLFTGILCFIAGVLSAVSALADNPVLTLVKSGSGTGLLTSSPVGIACGTTCNAPFSAATWVTLSATPVSGSTFGGWRGACTGITTTCSVFMDGNQSVTAIFDDQVPGEQFPDLGVWPAGWLDWGAINWPKGGTPSAWMSAGLQGSIAPWAVDKDSVGSGIRSLKSGSVLPGQVSAVGYAAAFTPGHVSFALRVSGKVNEDFLEFYVDGVLKKKWTGEVPWGKVTFALPTASSMMMWRYVKPRLSISFFM